MSSAWRCRPRDRERRVDVQGLSNTKLMAVACAFLTLSKLARVVLQDSASDRTSSSTGFSVAGYKQVGNQQIGELAQNKEKKKERTCIKLKKLK